MLLTISEKSKLAFQQAAKKIGTSPIVPDLSLLRPDIALYMTAIYMLTTIIEAEKEGAINDITNHDVRKYENWFYAKKGYVPGSSGGGFSYYDFARGYADSAVGARLSHNSVKEGRTNAEEYSDLWEIFILYVK